MSLLDDLAAPELLILGLAREGLSTLAFLRRQYPSKRIAIADRRRLDQLEAPEKIRLESSGPVELHLGTGYAGAIDRARLIFKSPGISPFVGDLAEPLRAFVARGGRISSNTELFFDLAGNRTIGVTGTKGKSTTTSAIHHVLSRGGLDARLTGNIGIPPLDALEGANDGTLFVAELSSHQLLGLRRSPRVGVIQDIVPEHLDYYGQFDRYVEAKAAICAFQTSDDYVLYNAGYRQPRRLAARSPGHQVPFGLREQPDLACYVRDGCLVYRDATGAEPVLPVSEVPLRGEFNLQNVMPAVVVARLIRDLPVEVIASGLRSFQALEHRLELVGTYQQVSYYNDSLATVPEATLAAIDALGSCPIVLIAGGFDRGQDFGGLAEGILRGAVTGLVLFPPAGVRLWDELARRADGRPLPARAFVETMPRAVDVAARLASAGGAVVLSPAAASFGAFRDYRDRGNQFKAEVARIGSRT